MFKLVARMLKVFTLLIIHTRVSCIIIFLV